MSKEKKGVHRSANGMYFYETHFVSNNIIIIHYLFWLTYEVQKVPLTGHK